MLVQYLLHFVQIFLGADEGMGYEVNVFLNGKEDVALVLLGERGQVDVYARHVDRLVGTQFAVVHHYYSKLAAAVLYNLHTQLAVIEQYLVAYLHVVAYIGIRQAYHVVGGVLRRTAHYCNLLASLVVYRCRRARGAYLRSLCVNQDGKMSGDLTGVPDNLP